MKKQFDVAIVGGGPGGYAAAIKIAQLGGSVVLFERDTIGGTCLNVGCIPTKCLLEKAGLLEKIRQNTENGVLRDAGMFSWKKIQLCKDDTVHKLTAGVGGILSSYGIAVVQAEATVTEAGTVCANGERYAAQNIIIATGSSVLIPPISGVNGSNVITSTQALSLEKVPARMVIIGGGVIGLEFASIYHSFGTEITVIEMQPDILAGEDHTVVAVLRRLLEKKGIGILTSAKVKDIRDDDGAKAVCYELDGKEALCHAEYVLVAAGRKPNTTGIALAGLEKEPSGAIRVNAKLETSIGGIYAIGDATGGMMLAHAAYAQAEAAAQNCMGGDVQADLSVMPRCVYSIPQYAAVGKTQEQLTAEGIAYRKGNVPYASNGKALAADEPDGMVSTLIREADGVIVGVQIVGGYATELLSGAVAAINAGVTQDVLERMIFPHPTMSELLRESALAADNKAIHMPKTR